MKSINKIYLDECYFIEAASQFFDFDKVIKNYQADVNWFEYTCPLTLDEKYKESPFLFVEYFFSIDGLGGHKKRLRKWFKTSLTESGTIANSQNFVFFHNMFTQLLNVGCLIVNKQIKYSPKRVFNNDTETFGQWLDKIRINSISKGDYYHGQCDVSFLSIKEKNDPYLFFKHHLTFKKVQRLRYGMLEWLYAVLSKKSNISDLEPIYLFEQYELMTKILEGFYLIITVDKQIELLN
ncbi:hypothetical protein [Pedobacter nototheniae]|uniref:hypothetical protein n=1 Tax=Pedobacter nototheniae TaxID=2488994 RepID=UPI00292E2A39|nr:hypothetical protein [Pedobacter nototheniae]